MPQRYLRLGKRVLCILAFPEGIHVQEIYPKIGRELSFPYEPWMKHLTKPSMYHFS